MFVKLDAVIHNLRISRNEMQGNCARAHWALNEISFCASCHQEHQLNVTNSERSTDVRFVCRWVRASLIDVPNFPERVLRCKRYPRRYIYSFFPPPREKQAPGSPFLFFITRVSAMHTGCQRHQFARKLQLKNISLWPVDHRPRWESSSGPESFSRLQPSIRACQKLKRVGNGARGGGRVRGWGRFEKGVRPSLTGRRFQIKTTPRQTRDISRTL